MPLKLKTEIKAPTFTLHGEERIALRDQRQDIGFSGLDELGRLNEFAAVGKFQTLYNEVYDLSQDNPADYVLTGGHLVVDNKYGRKTHLAFEGWIHLVNYIGFCTGVTAAMVRASGPRAAERCLEIYGFSAGDRFELQKAWEEWVAVAAANRAAGGGGGSGGGADPGGGGGGDDDESDANLPSPLKPPDAGYMGPILFAIDMSVGSFLSWWSKKWKRG